MNSFAVIPLFVVTAIAELAGCYSVLLWRRHGGSLMLPCAAIALGTFAWLLSFHPNAGRAYAAYGGVYVAAAPFWGWLVDHQAPDRWDLVGAGICVLGTVVISFGPRV